MDSVGGGGRWTMGGRTKMKSVSESIAIKAEHRALVEAMQGARKKAPDLLVGLVANAVGRPSAGCRCVSRLPGVAWEAGVWMASQVARVGVQLNEAEFICRPRECR